MTPDEKATAAARGWAVDHHTRNAVELFASADLADLLGEGRDGLDHLSPTQTRGQALGTAFAYLDNLDHDLLAEVAAHALAPAARERARAHLRGLGGTVYVPEPGRHRAPEEAT